MIKDIIPVSSSEKMRLIASMLADTPKKDSYQEECLLEAWIGPGSTEDYDEYQENLNSIVFIDGCINLTVCLCISVFIGVQLFRRSKLSWLNWVGLAQLIFILLLLGIAQIHDRNDKMMTTACNHGLKVVYGIEGFTMMNLATFIGYKIYLFCFDMAEFVRSGNLPDAASLSLRKKLIYIFWSLFAAFFVLYILTNIYFLMEQIFTIKNVQVF